VVSLDDTVFNTGRYGTIDFGAMVKTCAACCAPLMPILRSGMTTPSMWLATATSPAQLKRTRGGRQNGDAYLGMPEAQAHDPLLLRARSRISFWGRFSKVAECVCLCDFWQCIASSVTIWPATSSFSRSDVRCGAPWCRNGPKPATTKVTRLPHRRDGAVSAVRASAFKVVRLLINMMSPTPGSSIATFRAYLNSIASIGLRAGVIFAGACDAGLGYGLSQLHG
jgi:hypothetical protein